MILSIFRFEVSEAPTRQRGKEERQALRAISVCDPHHFQKVLHHTLDVLILKGAIIAVFEGEFVRVSRRGQINDLAAALCAQPQTSGVRIHGRFSPAEDLRYRSASVIEDTVQRTTH